MLLANGDREKLKRVKTKLMNSFETTDLGEPNIFLRVNIERNRNTRVMTITQKNYIALDGS